MASLRNEILLEVPAAEAWAALKNISRTHELFAGVLVDGRLEGDIRIVTFASGMVARERIVAVDDSRMRVAYAVLDSFEQHAASMQIVPVNPHQCRFVFVSDFLPDTSAEIVGPLMTQGCLALKRVLEARHRRS
jgi:Polyketide cyclase / dehydrase and lipid transport